MAESNKKQKTSTLKLILDRKAQKVLFAEAGKEFVSFFHGLLSLPIGTIKGLFADKQEDIMVGCLDRVYNSAVKLNTSTTYSQLTLTQVLDSLLETNPSDQLISRKSVVGSDDGNVQGTGEVGTFMVLDDMSVMPMSTLFAVTFGCKLIKTKDVDSLEEVVVDVGRNQYVQLLEASLRSKTVLTDVFFSDEYFGDKEDPEFYKECAL